MGTPGPARHGQPAARADQVAEGEAVAALEGLAGALAVVGEDDDAVRARGVLGDVLDQRDGTVQALEHLGGVAAARAGVVGDLVVGHEVGVDGGAAGEHVAHDGGDDDVPFDDGREGADEGIEAAALDPGALLGEAAAGRLADLAADLGDEGHRGADGVGRVGEVGEVARAGTVLAAAAANGDGQDEGLFVGAAAEQVAAAGAVEREETAVAGELDGPALEFGRAGRAVADHHLAGVLLEPAERGDVVVGAVQDAELAGARLAGPVGAPGGEAVAGAVAAEELRDGRHQPLGHGCEQHVVADSVELQEDGAGRGRAGWHGSAAAVGEAVEAAAVGVVVAHGEGTAGGGGYGGHHGGHDDRGLGGDLAAQPAVRVDAQGDQQQRPVEHEDEETEDERGHQQQQPYQQRPHQGRQQTEGSMRRRTRP